MYELLHTGAGNGHLAGNRARAVPGTRSSKRISVEATLDDSDDGVPVPALLG